MGKKEEEDTLERLEMIARKMNDTLGTHTRSVFGRYPILFSLLVVFGFVAVSEGVKGIIETVPLFYNHPWYMLIAGLVVLIVTGSLYKKLEE